MGEASFILRRYPEDEGEHVVEDMVIHREGLGTVSFLSEAKGRCVATHAKLCIASVAFFCYIVLGLNIYGMYDSWRLIFCISFF